MTETYDIGNRLELLGDGWLIEAMKGADLRLQHPNPHEISLQFDQPWEGNTCAYVTVFQDGGIFRMYYRGSHWDYARKLATHQVVCYAESQDGISWERPELGLFEFQGSKKNNIVWTGPGSHNFAPFKDTNPDCREEERYKALGGDSSGLLPYGSADGTHWHFMREAPVITEGKFDSQNLAFWDEANGRYLEFHRGSREGYRDIMVSESRDFLDWTEPRFLDFGDAPLEHLYTNAIRPYHRAPHILVGFPKRFLPQRKKVPEHPHQGLSDGVFMMSRDGLHWRRWIEAFARPGPQRERWWERNNMISWGFLETPPAPPGHPRELSFYLNENYYEDGVRLRRFTLRMDGFVSVHAGHTGGEFTTRPLVFEGSRLLINYSTSAAGSIRVELQNLDGSPIPGFEMKNCPDIYGDEIDGAVKWDNDLDLSNQSGREVRLRFAMRDADLYSLQFV